MSDPWAAAEATLAETTTAIRKAEDAILAELDRERKLSRLDRETNDATAERLPAMKLRRQ